MIVNLEWQPFVAGAHSLMVLQFEANTKDKQTIFLLLKIKSAKLCESPEKN